MAIDRGDRITILHSLTFQLATEAGLPEPDIHPVPFGGSVVLSVGWLEKSGGRATLISEEWSPIAHNMWRVTSPKN